MCDPGSDEVISVRMNPFRSHVLLPPSIWLFPCTEPERIVLEWVNRVLYENPEHSNKSGKWIQDVSVSILYSKSHEVKSYIRCDMLLRRKCSNAKTLH